MIEFKGVSKVYPNGTVGLKDVNIMINKQATGISKLPLNFIKCDFYVGTSGRIYLLVIE